MVIVIISAMVALALPRYTSVFEKTRSAEGLQVLEALRKAQWSYYYEHNSAYTSNIAGLDVAIPTMDNFGAPTVSSSATALATVARTDGSYTLRIADDGTISCSGAGTICSKIGF